MIRLIVGLGNPGPQYQDTRHNVGAVFVDDLARRFGLQFKEEPKLKGAIARGLVLDSDVRLLLPTTYMNDSGDSVAAVARYYKIEPPEILVAYDEVAFEPGEVKLKFDGGPNGHNGIRSLISRFGQRRDFVRLRIGVGHPGDKNKVVGYLTSQRLPQGERHLIEDALRFDDAVWRHLFAGDLQKAMTALHSE